MEIGIISTVGLNALSSILVLSLVALGLAIIFGFMGVINLAHGAYFMVGAYTVWFIATELGFSFWLGLVIAPLVVGLIGLATETLVVRHLYGRLFDTILATWGVAIVIQETIKIVAGRTSKTVNGPTLFGLVDLGVTTYPSYRIFLMGVSILILAMTFYLFHQTKFGVRVRAVIQNDEMASLLGIDTDRMYQLSFVIGAGLAGFSGAAMAPVVAVEPAMGTTYLLQSFLAVILGGAANLLGVVPGSIIIGGVGNVLTFAIRPLIAQSLVYVIAIGLIVLRPQGVLGGAFE